MPSDRKQGPRGGDDIREGVMRVETRALNQETAEDLVSLIEPDGGSHMFLALLAETSIGRAAVKLPDWLVQEGDTTSTTADCTRSSSSSWALGRRRGCLWTFMNSRLMERFSRSPSLLLGAWSIVLTTQGQYHRDVHFACSR